MLFTPITGREFTFQGRRLLKQDEAHSSNTWYENRGLKEKEYCMHAVWSAVDWLLGREYTFRPG